MMPRVRIRISCTGLLQRAVKQNMAGLEEDLRARPDVLNPIVAWDDSSESLIVVMEAEGDDPGKLADAALEQISEAIIAAFESADEQYLVFKIDSAQVLGGDHRMPS